MTYVELELTAERSFSLLREFTLRQVIANNKLFNFADDFCNLSLFSLFFGLVQRIVHVQNRQWSLFQCMISLQAESIRTLLVSI